MGSINKFITNVLVKRLLKDIAVIPPVVEEKESLELRFTEEYVTDCLNNNRRIHEWDGNNPPIRSFKVGKVAGKWKLVVITSSPTTGYIDARPTGSQTVIIFRESKVRELVALGTDEIFARLYIRRARYVRHSFTPECILWVWKNFLISPEHLHLLESAREKKKLAIELGYDADIDEEVLEYALVIINVLRRDDQAFKLAVTHFKNMGYSDAKNIRYADDPINTAIELGYNTHEYNPGLTQKTAMLRHMYCVANNIRD